MAATTIVGSRFAALLVQLAVIFAFVASVADAQADWSGSGSYLSSMGGGDPFGGGFNSYSSQNTGGFGGNPFGGGFFGR